LAEEAGREGAGELQTADEVLPRAPRECYRWLLCPVQETPTESKPGVEAFPLNTTGGSVGREMERVCVDNLYLPRLKDRDVLAQPTDSMMAGSMDCTSAAGISGLTIHCC
jgi:hypothetical protein